MQRVFTLTKLARLTTFAGAFCFLAIFVSSSARVTLKGRNEKKIQRSRVHFTVLFLQCPVGIRFVHVRWNLEILFAVHRTLLYLRMLWEATEIKCSTYINAFSRLFLSTVYWRFRLLHLNDYDRCIQMILARHICFHLNGKNTEYLTMHWPRQFRWVRTQRTNTTATLTLEEQRMYR